MATINGSTSSSNWTFKLETVEGTPDIVNNNSPLTVKVFVGRSSSESYMDGGKMSCVIDVTGCANKTISYDNTGKKIDVAAGGWWEMGSATFTVPHDANGKKTVTVSASFTYSYSPNSASASGKVTLTDIVRLIHIKLNGVWKDGIVWVKTGGVWKRGLAWIKKSGVWKRGGA